MFVAVSINVDRILQLRGLSERALETVLLLLSVVIVSIIGLIPGLSTAATGLLVLGVGLVVLLIAALLTRGTRPLPGEPRIRLFTRVIIAAASETAHKRVLTRLMLSNDDIEDGLRELVTARVLVGWYSWMWTEGRHWTIRPSRGGCVTYGRDDVTAYLALAAEVLG